MWCFMYFQLLVDVIESLSLFRVEIPVVIANFSPQTHPAGVITDQPQLPGESFDIGRLYID